MATTTLKGDPIRTRDEPPAVGGRRSGKHVTHHAFQGIE